MSLLVYNLRTRRLNASPEEVGALIDSLAGSHDELWARDLWPEMRFDRPLGVGAVGGHGPVHYAVEAYEPGRWVRFRFAAPRGFDGFHEFTVHPRGPGITDLHHLMALRLRFPAWLTYPLLWRPLHDALIEDSFDRAERSLAGTVESPARWSPYVRVLRAILARTVRSRPTSPRCTPGRIARRGLAAQVCSRTSLTFILRPGHWARLQRAREEARVGPSQQRRR